MQLKDYLKTFPFIAILRGIKPAEVVDCCRILVEHGFRIIEIPLNSPDPFRSLEILANEFGDAVLVGAGTVTTVEELQRLKGCGGQLVVSPHTDVALIEKTVETGMLSLPGAATPTEAMQAIAAGANGLKLFPAEIITPKALRAMRAILPPTIPLIPVGSIDEKNWRAYTAAGAAGFGLGSSLYKSGMSPATLESRACCFSKSIK